MNILTQLKAEHDEVAEIFQKLEKTTERAEKTRQELFEELDRKLTPHAEGEEKTLYARMKEDATDADLVLEAFEEHAIAKQLLAELRELSYADDTFGAKVTTLKEIIEHHVEEEEGPLFRLAKSLYDTEELEQICEDYLAQKESILTRMDSEGGGERLAG